jgi:PAS domain S-box-containing protein
MQTPLSLFQRRQLEVIARVTPHSMAGHILNTTVLAVATTGSIPPAQLIIWSTYSYAIALLVLYRHTRNRGRVPRNFQRATRRATIYACFLALPWSVMAVLHMGELAHDQELILLALTAGMAASGAILLSALPVAAFSYMSGILLPSALKSLLLLNSKGYLLLGVLVLSYWWFLAALISKVAREISERKRIDVALKESEVRLQQTLRAGQMVAFAWDAKTGLSRHSENASQILGLEMQAGHGLGKDFLSRLHADDRKGFFAQIKGLCPERPSYSASFRFIRPDAREMWLEETGKAEFDSAGRRVRIKGLTCDITERKRAEEQQRFLVRELDHRVKNVLASTGAVAQRTGEGSGSIDEFLQRFDGRIQSMANAHALLSRSHWEGVRLAELVHSELEPCVRTGGASVEGPNILLLAEATQPIAIALHELVTNALKYGALSSQRGHITVRWQCQNNDHAEESLLIEWIETGGPAVVAPRQTGYGIRAIRSLIPYELSGSVDLVFDPGGVRCRIEVPYKRHNSSEPVELFKASDANPCPIATVPAESRAAAFCTSNPRTSRGPDLH